MDPLFNALASLILGVARFVLTMVIQLMDLLLDPIIEYNDFIDHPMVTTGWTLVRDISNVGFIAVMILLAFLTMFNHQRAHWKQQIPVLAVAAIAINFSRLIVGFLIDIGQVFMSGFANAIKAVGASSFIELLHLDKLESLSVKDGVETGGVGGGETGVKEFSGVNAFITALFVLAMVLIVAVMIGMLMAILVYRIVILWILTIMAPLAFFAKGMGHIVEHAPHWYSKWWDKLVAAIMVGPMLTFFIWLAMTTVASTGQDGILKGFHVGAFSGSNLPILSSLFDPPQLTGFIIAIAILFLGMELATESAGALGGMAGKIMHGGEEWAKKAGKAPFQGSYWLGKKAGDATVGNAARATRDQFRGRYTETRHDIQNRVEKGKAEAIAKGGLKGLAMKGVWAAAGGAAGLVVGNKKDEKKAQEELAKKVSEKGLDALSLAQKMAFIKKNANANSEEKRAMVGALRAGMVGNEKEFADLMRDKPAEAAKMLADARAYNDGIGAKDANDKIDAMLKKNIAWKHGDAAGVTADLNGMTAQEKQALSIGNWESAAFREGWRGTDAYKKMQKLYTGYNAATGKFVPTAVDSDKKEAERARSGYTEAQLKKIDEMVKMDFTDPDHDKTELARAQTERDAMRGLDMSQQVNKDRAASNETYARLESATTNGSVGALLNAGVDLETINTDAVDTSYANVSVTPHATFANINKVLTSVVGDKNAVGSLNKLRTSTSGNAGRLKSAMGGSTGALATLTRNAHDHTMSADKRATYQANYAALTGEVTAYDYDTTKGDFTGGTQLEKNAQARMFQSAVAKNGLIAVAIKDKMFDSAGNVQKTGQRLVTEIATAQDQKSLGGLLSNYEKSIGGEDEAQQREIVDTIGQAVKAHWEEMKKVHEAKVKVSIAGGSKKPEPSAEYQAAEKNMRFYERRVARQLDQASGYAPKRWDNV